MLSSGSYFNPFSLLKMKWGGYILSFIHLLIHSCVCGGLGCVPQRMWEEQRTTLRSWSLLPVQVLGIELRLSGLIASAFIP